MRRICIIGAMAEETAPVLAGIKGKTYPFRLRVITSGIGKVNAACALTEELARADEPDTAVISIGSIGGIAPGLRIGDIIISAGSCCHDVDLTPAGCLIGQLPGLPQTFESCADLAELAADCAKRFSLTGHKGLICSGDSFVSGGDRLEAIKARFPCALGVEMESAALAQVCYKRAPAVRFVSVKAVSDLADDNSEQSFNASLNTAAHNSAQIILAMLDKIDKKP